MACDHSFDVLDVVRTLLLELLRQLLIRFVVDAREGLVDLNTPYLGVVFACTGLDEDEAFVWEVNETADGFCFAPEDESPGMRGC